MNNVNKLNSIELFNPSWTNKTQNEQKKLELNKKNERNFYEKLFKVVKNNWRSKVTSENDLRSTSSLDLSISDERKAQNASDYQWQKDNIKQLTEQFEAENVERAVKTKQKQANYRRDLFGQMDYEKRKKDEVRFTRFSSSFFLQLILNSFFFSKENYENEREFAEGMQAEIEYQKHLTFELQQTGVSHPHPIRQWYSAKT